MQSTFFKARLISVILVDTIIAVALFCLIICVAHWTSLDRRIMFAMHPERDKAALAAALVKKGKGEIDSAKTIESLNIARDHLNEACKIAALLGPGSMSSGEEFASYLRESSFNADSLFWTIEDTLTNAYKRFGDKAQAKEAYRQSAQYACAWNKSNSFHDGWDTADCEIQDGRLEKLLRDYDAADARGSEKGATAIEGLASSFSEAQTEFRAAQAFIWQHWKSAGQKESAADQLKRVLLKFYEKQRNCQHSIEALASDPGISGGIEGWLRLSLEEHFTRIANRLMFESYFEQASEVLAQEGLTSAQQVKALQSYAALCRARHIDDQALEADRQAKKLQDSPAKL